jgi:hypothetical protein
MAKCVELQEIYFKTYIFLSRGGILKNRFIKYLLRVTVRNPPKAEIPTAVTE